MSNDSISGSDFDTMDPRSLADYGAGVGALSEAVRNRLEQGRTAFNRGAYFRAHELWEDAWRELDGVERIVLQGLIQIAAGLHHLEQRRSRPAAGLLRKGLAKVSQGAFAAPVDLRVDALARDVARLLAELDTPGAKLPDRGRLEL